MSAGRSGLARLKTVRSRRFWHRRRCGWTERYVDVLKTILCMCLSEREFKFKIFDSLLQCLFCRLKMSDVGTRSLRGCFQDANGRKVSLGVVDKEIEIERFSSRWIGR